MNNVRSFENFLIFYGFSNSYAEKFDSLVRQEKIWPRVNLDDNNIVSVTLDTHSWLVVPENFLCKYDCDSQNGFIEANQTC
ncbi:MAG: hypothetical protein MHPSP_003348, partial [Paramarteilia canceri]